MTMTNVLPPKHKDWCAIFYFVAQEDQGIDYPDTSLDKKLEETIKALKESVASQSFDGDKIHVVYRAIWADIERKPVASVVGGSTACPDTDYPPGCKDTSTPVTTGTDLTCVLKWAYKCCPAKQYAVFFWGHSFGPAGLFEPGGPINIPRPPGLVGLRKACENFNILRREMEPALLDPKVDIILFQDCWMSTLETAYELQDVVHYVIASQSLLPIGAKSPTFVWPYETLLKDLLGLRFPDELMEHVYAFYKSNLGNIATELLTVPIALLDLTRTAGITKNLDEFVKNLPVSREERWPLIEQGRIAEVLNGEPLFGDAALIDVRELCGQMHNPANLDLSAAADSLLKRLAPLIKRHEEAIPPGGKKVGFGGISVLYWPGGELLDTYITQALRDSYKDLEFSKTSWPAREWAP